MAKRLKGKVRKFLGIIPTFVEVTGEKLIEEFFGPPPPLLPFCPSFPSWIELLMVLIKIGLLIFFFLSWYELVCKYRIISEVSIFKWMRNCIFQYFWYCIYTWWFVTWWVKSIIICSDKNLTQNIIWETIKVGEKQRWIKIEFWHIPVLMVHVEHDMYF